MKSFTKTAAGALCGLALLHDNHVTSQAIRSLRASKSDQEVTEEGRLQFRRSLLRNVQPQHLFALTDPRSEELKKLGFMATDGVAKLASKFSIAPALTREEVPRPLEILSFGTSQTYGHGLEDRSNSYPYLITPYPDHVDNLALPATAADHPSICLESMIPLADKKNYDLIMFEYPSNQSDGVRLLLKRLRERYPDAIIMWVHVWHFVGRARIAGTSKGPAQAGRDPSLDWEWRDFDTFSAFEDHSRDCIREICHLDEMLDLLAEVDAVPYLMEQTKSPQEILEEGWFAEDWHHLSQQGHQNVAREIAELLKTGYNGKDLWTQAFRRPKTLGSWALGDQCFNWYYSGDVKGIQYDSGAEMSCHMEQDPIGCTLDIVESTGGATVTFESGYNADVPFAIGYMTKGYPDVFPNVLIQVNGGDPFPVNPDFDRTTRVNPKSTSMVTSYIQAGYAKPGKNTIRIVPTEVTPSPFQVVGIYMCGACRSFQRDHMGLGSLSMDNRGDVSTQLYNKDRLKGIMGYP